MKQFSFLAIAVCCMTLAPQIMEAKPASTPAAKTKLSMPPEVRAMMAPGATTIHFLRLPIGAKGAPVLLHAWRISRRSSQTPNDNYVPFLVCVDFFSNNAGTGKKWELASSTSYVSYGAAYPNGITYEPHWLDSKTKQGLVIVETNSHSTGATVRLITLPQGVGNGISEGDEPYVQQFYTSHSGGGQSVFIDFGRDARGQMTLEERILPHAVAPRTHNTYAWKGDRWVKVASRKTKQ